MKYSFVVESYRKSQLRKLKLLRPDLPDSVILEVIDREIENDFINPKIIIHNNFKNIKVGENGDWDLNKFFILYEQRQPITTEHGVMYYRHDQEENYMGQLLSMFLSERKVNKKEMLNAKQRGDFDAAEMYDTVQKVWKILANSFYGALGQSSCIFYNHYVAASVTGKGQSIISTAMTTFENFLAGSIKYRNLDELMTFITNVMDEPDFTCKVKMRSVTDDELKVKLINDCEKHVKVDSNLLDTVISQLSQEQKTRLFFKNNFKTFLKEKAILKIVDTVINCKDQFRSGEHVPESIKDVMNDLWESVNYYVFYNHIKFEKINILRNNEREVVLGVDTDSNFIALYNHYTILQEELQFDPDDEENTFKIVSILSFLLSNVIREAYELYTKNCNVVKEKRPIIAMKNEYTNYNAHIKVA